ncbi:MAG: hypothetical protein NVSMB60_17460 [Mycobacterium sp.]
MPDFFIKSAAIPSSVATAFLTALTGNGMAGTSGGGMPDCDCAVGGGVGSVALALQPAISAIASAAITALTTVRMT